MNGEWENRNGINQNIKWEIIGKERKKNDAVFMGQVQSLVKGKNILPGTKVFFY